MTYNELVQEMGSTEPFINNNQLNPFYTFTGNWTIKNSIGDGTFMTQHDRRTKVLKPQSRRRWGTIMPSAPTALSCP